MDEDEHITEGEAFLPHGNSFHTAEAVACLCKYECVCEFRKIVAHE